MQSSFTQGPWIADGAQIFTSDTNVAQANGYRIDRETVAANARLIAAAPELLEALKESHNALELFASDDSPCGQIAVAAVMEARSAIAKATGENT